MNLNELALVWPSLLRLPSDSVRIVYLDLNHWIYLAKAAIGSPRKQSDVTALEACRKARNGGAVNFVLSATHYIEMLKIKDPAQRRAIADVMEELTDFATLVSRVVVVELELSSMLDPVAESPGPQVEVQLIGRGVRHAAGLSSEFRIMGPAGDEKQVVRERMGREKFDLLNQEMMLQMERSALRGPTDDEVDGLRAYGFAPESVIEIGEKRAAEERALSDWLNAEPEWRRGRLYDLVSVRELGNELGSILLRALEIRGLNITDVAADQDFGRRFVRSMPSTAVSIAIKTQWHKNRDKRWCANDIHDIDALAIAVPYCDIVVTEKACHHLLKTSRLGQRMHTALLRDLDELPSALEKWQPKRCPNEQLALAESDPQAEGLS